ncbi:MAG: translation initiation factor IF-2 N-terminal domain-containing protein, partial [Deltaproteobacteria bacterium]|nr:translation initiation factor IF-2 N-terminal domain-containing protein [Deltaproteobacteria bacterium]
MAKTRILNLAKELSLDVKVLMQRLKEEMGLQVDNYLSSIDDAVAARVRQAMSQAEPQVEEKRVGENIKRRRRVAPVVAALPMEAPEEPAPPPPPSPPPPEAAPKARKPKEAVARVVSLPSKEAAPPLEVVPPAAPEEPTPPPAAGKIEAAAPGKKAKAVPPGKTAAPAAPADSGTALKRQKGKVRKKEIPARIISLPTEPAPEPAAAAPPPAAAPAAPGAAPAPRPGVKLVPAAKPPT